MRILIDILHPAHVHFFRNFYREMRERGHDLLITARAKECSLDLLDAYALPYRRLSTQRAGALRLAGEFILRTYRLLNVVGEYRPDVLTGIMGPSIALTGVLRRVPAVVFYDTEFATQTNWFSYRLAHSVCTPDCYRDRVPGNHRTYPGYHELAYLHPSRFRPDPAQLRAFGVSPDEPYFLVRFVGWAAIHDRREKGLTGREKRQLVETLQSYGRVFVSSEGPLPPELERLRVRGPASKIHHLLAHARLLVGESATMASEAAVLGVPAIFIATTSRGYIDDLESRYGLVRYLPEDRFEEALKYVHRWLGEPEFPERATRARRRLLSDKVDVTGWMTEYFESEFGGS